MKEIEKNQELYKDISSLIVDKFFSGIELKRDVNCGPPEVNDYSICFWIDVFGHSSFSGIYVKIPKADLVFKNERKIIPLTNDDKKLGGAEYQSLIYLSQYWRSDDIGVSFVQPLGFFEDYNAIVTKRIYGGDLFRLFRKRDLLGRLRINDRKNLVHRCLFHIGMALSRFHKTAPKEDIFKMEESLTKIEHYCSQLESFGADHDFCNRAVDRLAKFKDYTTQTYKTTTLKGLDIRNILIDDGGKLFMLDPGKMEVDWPEADLARFMVTCRILYWGGMLFFLRFCPNASYEQSFLQGYYGSNVEPNKLLIILLIKELLKHWRMAHVVLELKSWSPILKSFLRNCYINPFYRTQINAEIIKIER